MCRLLSATAPDRFDTTPYLDAFAEVARRSKEYQGHGWGCSWLADGGWQHYRDIKPVWEDGNRPNPRTHCLLAHARSAFNDEGIRVENNMPFTDGDRVFLFNGELRGVRIKEEGRIGAEKIFNFVKRYDRGDLADALGKGLKVISSRTRSVRAMNVMLANKNILCVTTRFAEDPDYFQLRTRNDGDVRLHCSAPFAGEEHLWSRVAPDEVYCFELASTLTG